LVGRAREAYSSVLRFGSHGAARYLSIARLSAQLVFAFGATIGNPCPWPKRIPFERVLRYYLPRITSR
jgi:hypothetical protein